MRKLSLLFALFCALGMTAFAAPRVQDPYGQPQAWHTTLSVDDQAQFNGYYAKWMDATRRNDRDDISDNARKMQDIMTRYNIPTSVSFDQIASASPYPNGAYAAGTWQGRLSAEDQKEFDKQYSKWMNSTRKNDQDDINESARKMQQIMARYSIPSGVPFAQVASGGAAVTYAAPVNGYPAYSYASAQQRLSSDDQHNFDKAYKKWVDARHKNHHEDIDENARKMQDIMARYNIPANVPFDQIASPGAANH